jgi:hypothetical protein
MLKAIVQKKTVGAEVFNRFPSRGYSIGAADHGGKAQKSGCQQVRLVASLCWRHEHCVSIRDNAL